MKSRVFGLCSILFSVFLVPGNRFVATVNQPTSVKQASPVLVDNFNDNAIDPSLWTAATIGAPTVDETNQRLEISIPANSTGVRFRAEYTSVFSVRGNFDIEVEYSLLVWPPQSGVRVGLRIDLPGSWGGPVERVGFGESDVGEGEVYLTHFSDGIQGKTPTSDQSGRLRLVRSGTVLTGYYFESDSWIPINSAPTIVDDVAVALAAWSHDFAFGDQEVLLAFDNFIVNQGIIVPGTGEPPLVSLPHQITEIIPQRRVVESGEVFFKTEFIVDYQGETVFFSESADGTGETQVDDGIDIVVTHAEGSSASFSHNYAPGCIPPVGTLTPQDITDLFEPGRNLVSVRLYDICGGFVSSSPLYLGVSEPECTPNDPRWKDQWNMEAIVVIEAWQEFPDCLPDPVDIAIIDSGVDLDHPDLAGRIVRSVTVVGDDASDLNDHGSHISGIIGAVGSNGIGIVGIHPNAQLSVYKITDDEPNILSIIRNRRTRAAIISDLAYLIRLATDDGARIINISAGFKEDQELTSGLVPRPCFFPDRIPCDGEIRLAVKYAADRGVVIVVATMNTGKDEKWYPAAYASSHPNVIAVAASTPSAELMPLSSTGEHVTVAAPGGTGTPCEPDEVDCIWSLNKDGGVKEWQGTSQAAAHVSGIVALVIAANPGLTPAQIKDVIVESAMPFSTEPERLAGAGIVNASEAVKLALTLSEN